MDIIHTFCCCSGAQSTGTRRPANHADIHRNQSDTTDEQDEALQAAIQRSLTDTGPPPESQETFERPPPYNPHYNPAVGGEEDQEQYSGFDQVHEQVATDPPGSSNQGNQGPIEFEPAQERHSTSSDAATGFDAVHDEQRDEVGRSSLRQRHPLVDRERSLDDLRAARLARLNNIQRH